MGRSFYVEMDHSIDFFFQLHLYIIFDSGANEVKSGFLRRKGTNNEVLLSSASRHWYSVLRTLRSVTSQGSSSLIT